MSEDNTKDIFVKIKFGWIVLLLVKKCFFFTNRVARSLINAPLH